MGVTHPPVKLDLFDLSQSGEQRVDAFAGLRETGRFAGHDNLELAASSID